MMVGDCSSSVTDSTRVYLGQCCPGEGGLSLFLLFFFVMEKGVWRVFFFVRELKLPTVGFLQGGID